MEGILKSEEMNDVNYDFDSNIKELNLYQEGSNLEDDWIGIDIKQVEQLYAILTQILLIENAKK